MIADPRPPACPSCGSAELEKLVSRFSRKRSEDDALEDLSDETKYGDLENDPKALRRWVKDMSSVMDEDMDGDFEEALEEEFGGGGGTTRSAVDDTVY